MHHVSTVPDSLLKTSLSDGGLRLQIEAWSVASDSSEAKPLRKLKKTIKSMDSLNYPSKNIEEPPPQKKKKNIDFTNYGHEPHDPHSL